MSFSFLTVSLSMFKSESIIQVETLASKYPNLIDESRLRSLRILDALFLN